MTEERRGLAPGAADRALNQPDTPIAAFFGTNDAERGEMKYLMSRGHSWEAAFLRMTRANLGDIKYRYYGDKSRQGWAKHTEEINTVMKQLDLLIREAERNQDGD